MRGHVINGAVMMLARWTPYLESEMRGLAGVVGPGCVCLDAGAATGLYTLALSRLAGPSGQVHAVEPLSLAHALSRRVLRAACGPNVSRYALALGAEAGGCHERAVPPARPGHRPVLPGGKVLRAGRQRRVRPP